MITNPCLCSKYLDSHLRPYKCKYATKDTDCGDIRFSSNACLFRHEREAHGMHNHGVNPYLCDYPDCERAKAGNGFPRRWNQRDHMKRVHGWDELEPSRGSSNDRHSTDGSRRKRGTGGPGSVPMRRSGSYGRPQASAPYSKDARRALTSHHNPQVSFSQPMSAPMPQMTYAPEQFPYLLGSQGMYYQQVY